MSGDIDTRRPSAPPWPGKRRMTPRRFGPCTRFFTDGYTLRCIWCGWWKSSHEGRWTLWDRLREWRP